MFQLLIVTVGVSLAYCKDSPRIPETSYKDGKEYIYNYESQVLSGLPQGAKTWSGLKLKSSILVQTLSPWKVKLQMKSPHLYKINNFLDTRDPTKEMLPTELFSELMDTDTENMKQHILKPITFSYVRGHVEDLVTEQDDPEWSVNIKRAVLSLMEINFNERHSLSRDVPVLLSDNEPKSYKVIEPSVIGECETRYWVEPERSVEDIPGMRVHKLRDHNRCVETVVHTWGIFNRGICDNCDKMDLQRHISSQASVKYHLLGSPDQFIILNVVSESQYTFAPYAQDLGTLSTFSNQTLTLLDSRPISDQINDPSSPLQHERPLKVKMSDTESLPLSPRTVKLTREEKAETMEMVEKVLKGVEYLESEKLNEEIGELLSELARLLKTLDKPSLNSLFDRLLRDPQKMPKARKVFMEVLLTVGTYPCIDVFFDKLEKQEISWDYGAQAMATLSLLPKPDVFTVKRLMDFLEKYLKQPIENKMFRRTAWLTLGSMGNKMIRVGTSAVKDMDIEKQIVDELRSESNDRQLRRKLDSRLEEIRNKYVQLKELYTTTRKNIILMVQQLHGLGDSDSRRLSMKVMGSLGYEEFTSFLESIVRNAEFPEQIRIEAAMSMYDTLKTHPEKVEKIYLPLCLDRKQPDIIRMTAFSVVLFTERSRSALEIIVKSLEDEPNNNVGSFVYWSLMELSNLSTPCDWLQSLARNSSFARRFANISPPRWSTMMARSSFNEHLQMGYTYTHGVQYSPGERSPTLVNSKFTAALLGRIMDVFEFTYSGKGLDSFLDQLLEVSTGTSLETVLKTFLHPRQRRHTASNIEQIIKNIKEKISVKPRNPVKPEGFIGLRLFGHEIIYFEAESLFGKPIERRPGESSFLLDSITDKLSLVDGLRALLHTYKSLARPLFSASVPTETGLSVKIGIDNHAMLKFDGDLKPMSHSRSSEKSLISEMDALLNIRPSGLFELQGRMNVDMKYVRSGVSVIGKVYMDIPMKMRVNVEPVKSKLLVKFEDEKEFTPLMLESNAWTEIRRYPSTADQYPIPPELKEITHVDGCDSKIVMNEFGKDVLGRSFKIIGKRSNCKDSSMPLPPMNGKQQIYFKYEPISPTSLQIQIQHVSEADSEPVEQHEDTMGGSNWFPFSWFSFSKDSSKEQPLHDNRTPQDSRESAEYRDYTDSNFIDLEQKDLSIWYLKEKFVRETDILKSGRKCGLVVHIFDSNPESRHEIQLSTLYQRDLSDRKMYYTVEFRRKPKAGEENQWKMVTDIRLKFPEKDLKPSDLFDNEYQKHILEQIRMSVSENGVQVDSLFDLGSEIYKKATWQLKKLQNPESLNDMTEHVLNHILQNSVGSDSLPLTKAVHKQREVLRDITELRKQPVDPARIPELLKTLRNYFKQLTSVTDNVSKMLSQTNRGEQKSEDAVKVLYVLTIKEKANDILRKIIKKLQPVLTLNEKKDFETKLKEQEQDIERIKDAQRNHSMDKQSSELQKSTLEIDPDDRNLHSDLIDIEQKLIHLSMMKSKYLNEGNPPDSLESSKSHLKEILSACGEVKHKLDETLLQKSRLDKMLREKLFEVLLHYKLALYGIQNDIEAFEKKSRDTELTSPEYSLYENKKMELVRQKEELTRSGKEIAKRLVIAIEAEKERKSTDFHMTSDDLDKLTTLTKSQIKLLKIVENLRVYLSPGPNTEKYPSRESIQKFLNIVQETGKGTRDILDEESRDIEAERIPMINPVLLKCLKMLYEQSDILEKLQLVTKQTMHRKASIGDPAISSYKELEKNCEKLKEDTVKDMQIAESIVKMRNQLRPEQVSLSLPFDYQGLSSNIPVSLTVLWKRILKVEGQLLELRPLQNGFVQSVDLPVPVDQSAKLSWSVQHKQLLYEIISKLLASQDELDKVQEPLERIVKEQPKSEQVRSLLKVLLDKQADQLSIVRNMEKKLTDKSRIDLSLAKPLQTMQQLKDMVQRQQYETKLLLQQSGISASQGRSLPSDVHSPRLGIPKGSRSPWHMMDTDSSGVMKIIYGEEGKERKTVTIRLFRKKSLQQLLWEHDQVLPSMQDRVLHKYLSDRLEPNDPTAIGYRTIKDKLNTYRHVHAVVVYEDSLPVYVREYLWNIHEMVKVTFYPKLQLLMPNESNMKNTLEIKYELSTDEKWIDMEIKTPYETSRIKNVPAPEWMQQVSFSDCLEQIFISGVCTRHLPATCEITPDRVKMFTGKVVEVDLKSQPCESVLAMDCSPDSTLAITSRPLPQNSSKKIISVLTKYTKVEMLPGLSGMEVKVDGQSIQLPMQPDMIRFISDSKMPVFVKKIKNDEIEMYMPHLGLAVKSDGRKISLMVPQMYWSKLCGVCGSMDSYRPEELRGPQNVKYSDPQIFASTYWIPDAQCDPTPIQSKLGVSDIRAKSRQVAPLMETRIKEQRMNGIDKTCFSISPVKKCPPNTTPDGMEDHLVPFYCLRTKSSKTETYKQRARGQILYELKDKSPDMNENITMPKACVRQ